MLAHTKRRSATKRGGGRFYDALEAKRLLALAPLPQMTTNVEQFAQTVEDAVVRVDDQQRLLIRTTGGNNRVDFNLGFNFLHVNRGSFAELALELDPTQYDQIIVVSGGNDVAQVSGQNLFAQMHPDKLWVSAEVGALGSNDLAPIQIHASGFERMQVDDHLYGDVGPFIHTSNNRIRMYGSDGVDRLDMNSNSNFAIATSAKLIGDGYFYSSNVFGDLFVSGGGGEDFAALAGTRGFPGNAFFVAESTTGDDVYYGRDNLSRISNELWDGRFLDFETQRIDLLGGEDRSVVKDSAAANTYYRVAGDDLVGAYRRFIGSEFIEVSGANIERDTLFRPHETDAVFSESAERFSYTSANFPDGDVTVDENSNENSEDDVVLPGLGEEIIPDYFRWTFTSFERLVG